MSDACQVHALANQVVEFEREPLCGALPLSSFARFQNLLNGVQQALGVEQHGLIELAPLFHVHFASLQSLEIEPDGCDGRLQFMCDRVDEAVVLFIAADFADQKNRI